ncbi:hypothetical protein LCGC14_0874030 [marine sediment metagenome]|uniref:Uncharacterized protein n=1 Tax=marine sediment metagenome TaxID=412755 RepID=A0A0F9PPG1_9ZZZZ
MGKYFQWWQHSLTIWSLWRIRKSRSNDWEVLHEIWINRNPDNRRRIYPILKELHGRTSGILYLEEVVSKRTVFDPLYQLTPLASNYIKKHWKLQ